MMTVSIIVAIGKDNIIGKDGDLLWRLPKELSYFKKTTMGHHLIVGRKTFESFPKALPGRTTIILSRDENYQAPEGCFVCNSIEAALMLATDRGETESFIIGGAQVYKQAMPMAEKLYITEVDYEGHADAFFPEVDFTKWDCIDSFHEPVAEKNPLAWTARQFIPAVS